eukprot:gene11280-2052_t
MQSASFLAVVADKGVGQTPPTAVSTSKLAHSTPKSRALLASYKQSMQKKRMESSVNKFSDESQDAVSVTELVSAGSVLLDKGDVDAALEHFTVALSIDSDNPHTAALSARCYLQKGARPLPVHPWRRPPPRGSVRAPCPHLHAVPSCLPTPCRLYHLPSRHCPGQHGKAKGLCDH